MVAEAVGQNILGLCCTETGGAAHRTTSAKAPLEQGCCVLVLREHAHLTGILEQFLRALVQQGEAGSGLGHCWTPKSQRSPP